jgi:6-phosphogluconolactonase
VKNNSAVKIEARVPDEFQITDPLRNFNYIIIKHNQRNKMKLEIKIFSDPETVAYQIAEEISRLINTNAENGSETFIALSGGNTPKILFKKLSENFKEKIDWKKLHLFWGDERCVPPDDDQSNYGMTREYLLNNIDIPDKNIHRIRGEDDPETEVKRIADEIDNTVPHQNSLPRFDLNILGLGEDGHTASLFPGKKLKHICKQLTGIAVHPESSQKRISLTLDVINNSSQIIFMVTGKKKADIIYDIMSNKNSYKKFPAAKVKPADMLNWYLDEDAASKIKMP